jgi:hypothetical protein
MSPAVRSRVRRRLSACGAVAAHRFGREGEQVGSDGWPGGFSGESGDVMVGLVELCNFAAVPTARRR